MSCPAPACVLADARDVMNLHAGAAAAVAHGRRPLPAVVSHYNRGMTSPMEARNVLGQPLQPCSHAPLTGWYRDGCCNTGPGDIGLHTVCARMTGEFLAFSLQAGNDLITPHPEFGFPGLQPGDQWCVCVERWVEAYDAGVVAPVVLEASHISVLEFVDLATLREHAAV